MTWSAGINEIVSKNERRGDLSDFDVRASHAGCDSVTRTAGTPIYIDPINGSASWSGTINCPKNSLSEAVSAAISGDEIILQSGNYHDNVTIDNLDDLVIRAADGASVIFDGTKSITSDLAAVWGNADSDGIQEVDLPVAGWQLFYNYDEQVPARWPNAQFSDETVFDRSHWAEGTLTSNNNAYTQGWLTDAGPETGVHSGLNETINATGLDPVGAIAILNLGSFRSNSREITDWNSANGTFSYDPTGVSWKNKHHAYFLEGKRELIDIDGEWWFDIGNSRLHFKTPGGQDANNLDLRVKVQPFAISVENSDRVTIQGIDFFGTTVNFNNCDRCSFTNSTLEYPSTSKRGLGITGESEDDRWMTRFYRCTNTFVDQISVTNTDGGALEFHGSGGQSHNNTVNNSYFHAIDWTAADQKGLMTTIYEGGRDMYFTNNTVHLTGASSVLSIGDAPKVFYNEVWDVGHLQTDGAVVQVMQGEAPGAEIAYNWIHDVIKYGARFDAPINQVGEGMNGTMHHNVIWNAAGGLMVKGDYHDIHNNTVFNSSGKNDIIFLTDEGINNKNSTLHRNAVDSMADHRSDDVYAYPLPDGTNWNNWNGYTEGYRQSIASGYGSSNCIISNAQSLYCWGDNTYGSLGNGLHGTGVFSSLPVEITSFGTGLYPVKVATGGHHSCAILNDGTVSCWGYNSHGQLGDGTQISKYTPTPTLSLGVGVKAVDIVAGGHHSCAVLDDGNVKCWGSNVYGQLGDGTTTTSLSPITLSGFTGTSQAISLTAGWTYTCALIEDGSVKCWGRNQNGQLGLGTSGAPSTTPTQITSFGSGLYAVDVDAGWAQTCAVINDGRVMCWGQGSNGRLGTGNSFQQTTPTFTASLGTDRYAKQVVQGGGHGCAVIDDGTVKCWGSGISTGTGASSDVFTPTTTDSLGVGRTAHALIAGTGHVCAILDDATMTCWGTGGNGRLGNGATDNELSPVPVITAGVPQHWQVSDFLVDPDNRDFRPMWGSPLHILGAGAYAADEANPWVPGTKWSYSPLSSPTVGCTDEGAINYDSNAQFEDGSCYYISITPSATSAQLTANTPMTPITISATTSYVTNASLQPFDYTPHDTHQDMDIAIDRNGNSHICFRTNYGTGNLYYMTDVTGSWAWEAVQTTNSVNVGLECNIAIDSNDHIHIVYQKTNTEDIRYATRAISYDGSISGDSTWAKSNLYTATAVGAFISMDIDEHDTLYVAYFEGVPDGQDLRWSKKVAGGSWAHGIIHSGTGPIGRHNSIVVDDADLTVHAVYKHGTGNYLKYAYKEGSNSWVRQNVDSSTSTSGDTSIAIDSNSHVHIAYSNNAGTKLYYSTNAAGSGFVTTIIDEGANAQSGLVLQLDDNDKAHIAYHNSNGNTLNYSSNAQGSWITQTLDGESSIRGKGVSMELNRNGDMHLVYLDEDTDQLRFGKFRSLANIETYEIHPDLPTGLSFGANNGTIWGTPVEAFAVKDYTIYANTTTRSATATVQLMSMWQVEPSVAGVEIIQDNTITPITFNWTGWSSSVQNSSSAAYTAGQSGYYNSIVTDTNNKVHIVSYRAGSKEDLRYTTNESGSWITTTIDSDMRVGQYCSIAIDSSDGLHVSYHRNEGNDLKYAYKASGSNSWSKETIDGSGGRYTSIAIDSNDNPHISYRESGGQLTHATCSSNCLSAASWSFSPIITGVDVEWNSIAIDSSDHIHVAMYDATLDDLHYATDSSGTWVGSNLKNIFNAGGMALDIAVSPVTDEPGISYFNAHSDDLEYKVYDGSSWSTEVIHFSGSVGRYNSLAYDSQGSAHISYEMNGAAFDDLWYATDATGSWVTEGIYVHPTERTGLDTAITVDANDDIHIAHRNTVNSGNLYHQTIQGYISTSSTRSALSGATCTFSPSLPSGLSVEDGTCTISGAPTIPQVNTTHTITVTSSTGLSYTGQFYLNVLAQTPIISYSGSPFTLTKDSAISTITPTNTGGAATSWTISPTEPTGLTFDTSTGEITGTPTSLQTTPASYTITATNSGGTDTTIISLAIIDQAPIISYTPTTFDLIVDEAMTSVTPSNSGGAATSWSISPGVPNGLNFDTATGELSGTPTLDSISQVYTVTATNTGGSDTASLTIEVQVFATLTSSVDGISDVPNSAITPITFTHTINGDTSSPAWTTGVSTSSSQVIAGSYTQGNDIAQGPNGAMAVVGYESISNDMKLAYYYDGSWTTSVIQNSVTDLKYPSIGIDSSGVVHIVYLDMTNDVLRYATNSSGSWNVIDLHSTLGSDKNVGKGWIAGTDLAIDSLGNIHIVYSTKNSANTIHTINYTTNQGGSWSSTNISDVTKNAFDPAIALDSNDKVHVSYFRETGNNLIYASNSGGSWNMEIVDEPGNQGKYSSIAVDYSDVVHISYINDDPSNDLKLASGNSGSWSLSNVQTNQAVHYTSIAADSNGDLHIVYGKFNFANNYILEYVTNSSGSWNKLTLSSDGGTFNSISIDSNDDIHIVHSDVAVNQELEHATTPGSGKGVKQHTTWQISPALPAGLHMNWRSGVISGTPTSTYTNTTHTVYANVSGNSVSTTIYLEFAYDPPVISYTQNDLTFTKDVAISTISPANSGGAADSWAISPAFTNGLNFDTATGEITGTPNVIETRTMYTITATNSGGTATTHVNITVNDEAPAISYNNPIVLTKGIAMAPESPTSTGGAVVSYAVDPSQPLPAGLSLDSSTGVISGTPTTNGGQAEFGLGWFYTINASNSGGNTSALAYITVNDQEPDISYIQNDLTLTKGTLMGTVSPSNSGGVVETWSISPGFSNGLNFDTTTGEISGTPNTLQTRIEYTITATNSGGTSTAYVNITINDAPPGTLSYSPVDMDLTLNQVMTPNTVSPGGGAITGWEIEPDVPNGLNFGSSNGTIWGTPTVLQTSPITYTIWANNSGGSTSTTVTITINDEIPSFSYSPDEFTFTKGVTISSTILPTNTGGTPTSYTISPNLLNIFHFNINNGMIGGTPSTTLTRTQFTITATNSGGSSVAYINVTINDAPPSTFSYSPVDMDLTLNQAMTPNTVSPGGGAVTSWEIEPDVPNGLNFGPSNGTIWGTPTVLQTSPITYTIWANNTGGSSSTTVTITIIDDAAVISYSLNEILATLGVPISPQSNPTNTGGAVETWEISPDPGPHFHFNTANGIISGTPGALLTRTQYTIYANNSGGSAVANVHVTVNDVAPSITYSESSLTLIVNSVMTPLPVINSGGTIVSCSDSPSLPTGLSLSNTCEITGTPTVTTTNISYTITATNSGGTDSTTIYILVQSNAGTLTISPINTEGSVNTTISDITMTYTHAVSSYGWSSGVSNISSVLSGNLQTGDGSHWLGIDSGEQGEMAVVFARNDTGATTHDLALRYLWNGVWTESLIDNGIDTGQHPSVAIDRHGALHIAYVDLHNGELRYATNASGSWVLSTLGVASVTGGGRGTAIVVHPITDAVHIVTTINENTYRDLQYHTNQGGSWVNETITNTSRDEGNDPTMVMDGDGNLYVAYYCSAGCNDLRMSSRINGVWQNETIAGVANLYNTNTNHYNIGTTPEMAIDSQGTLHIVSQFQHNQMKRMYLHSGTPGNWFENRNLSSEKAHWPAIAVDSNDAVHIAYHIGANKHLKYLTNASGSWIAPVLLDGYGGWGSVMEIDTNDDIFIAHSAPNNNAIHLTTVKGSGQGLTAIPMFDISPPLPDGLTMNWRTGTISGTPTEVHVNTTHTVTVTALGFTTTATFTLYITGAPGSIAYADISGTHHSPITPQVPTFTNSSTSGDITTWETDPMLPTGLNIGSANGTIWGTPSVIIAGGVYVIWANNSVGSSSTTVNITVNAQAPGAFNYNPVDMDLTLNQAITPNTVSPGGGAVTSWEIEPDVPNGLNFGSSNGTIWGTPTVLQTSPITYTIWANNSGGSSSTTVTITINDEVPTLSYPSSPYTIIRGYDMTDITPTVGGGTVLTWEISPSLPNGLSFTSGIISGKPFANQTTVTYTVYANNSGGSGSASFDLTINEPTPNIDYHPDNYTLTNNTPIRIDPILQAGSPAGQGTLMTGSSIRASGCMQLIGDLIFFIARDELPGVQTNTGYELWVFNHTQNPSASNPYLVKDINPGSSSSFSSVYSTTNCLSLMFVHNNTLFFKADDGTNGYELWKSDGTNAGTTLLKDIRGGSSSGNPRNFFTIGDTLYFSASTSNAYNGIWKTDGTTAGTTQISNTCGYNFNCGFTEMVEYNGSIYGSGYDWSAGNELFVMNGTTWQMVVDLSPGSNFNIPLHTNPRHLTVFDDWLYFDSNNLGKIYRTNGTAVGTTEFISGTTNGYTPMQVFNDELYFVRQGMGASGYELWKTDGTNIMLVKDVNPSNFGANSGFCTGTQYHTCSTEFQVFGDYMLFVANGGSTGPELWITDGTTAGTQLLKDINPGATGSIPQDFFVMGDVVYFRANDGTNGYELWRTDGTATGTVLVNDILLGSSGATPWDFIQVGDDLYFSAASSSGIGGFFQVNNAANGIIGAPTTWSISPPTLPSGLSFNNGVISGTPTVLQLTPIMYTITASNANGSSSTTINLTIIDAAPGTFAYNPVDMDLTLNQAMTPNTVSPSGGAVTSWEISPDLPAGLNFESSNGTIWGTPTILQIDPVMYTIWANNSGGSVEVNVNITINDEAPDIEYNPDWFVVDKGFWLPGGQLNPPLSAIPTNSGGDIPGEYIHTSNMGPVPGQYNSIAIDSNGFRHVAYYSGYTTGYSLMYATDMSGTWVRYTVDSSATYIGQHTSIAIDSNDKVHISYFDDTNTDLKYATNAGGAWATVSVDTSSVGKYTSIAVDSNDAVHISYYDTSFRDLKYATCSAVCSQASSWTTLTIDSTGIVGHSSSIAIDSSDTIHISYRASQLKHIKYATCSSSCSTVSSWTTTTIDNSGEATDPSIVVDSNDDVHIAYRTNIYASSTSNLKHTTCSSSCSSAASWTSTVVTSATGYYSHISIAVDSNDGLHISYALQTPGTGSWSLNYATCSSSCSSTSSWTNITVDDPPYGATYNSIAVDSNDRVHIVYYQSGASQSGLGHGLRHITLDASSNVYGYTISPDLPNGLRFDVFTGEISGTALEISANTTYTITARNSGGFDTTTVTIEVVDQLPTVAYSPDNLQLTNNTVSGDLPLTPTLTGFGAITSWELNNTNLPSGVSFGSNNGTFYGTPTELWPTTAYKVWANNTGGSVEAYLNITVVDEVPTLTYLPDNLTLTKDQPSTDLPLAPSLTGSGAITSWEISPDLPNGLNFGASNGTIWGIPTVLQTTAVNYTIWANNSGGSTSATVTITVIDEAPSISYAYDDIVATLNVSISPHSGPTNTGGAVTTWEISPSPGPAFHFNTYNGVISGTPGVLLPTTQYTVYANNSGGSSIAYVNVTVNPDAPNISYSPNELNLTRATTSSDLPLSPTNTGGNMQTASFCSSINSPPLFVVSDHEGTRHVLCNKDLYSIYLNGTQTVSTNLVSGNPFALEIDEDGHLHIGHWTYTYPYAYIHHATNKHGSWQSSDVYWFSGGYDGDDFKMAVGSDDSLHFTYTTTGQGGNSNDLRYLTNQSGSWSSASVASATGGHRAEDPQIALNSEDVPHIIYNTFSWGVNVVKYDNNTVTNLFSSSPGYKFGDIMIDSNDHVHVTYSKYQGLYYSTNASGSWQSSTIASLGGTVLDTRIALDSNDHPHVMSASITGQYNNYKHVSHYNQNGTSWNGGIITPAMSSISQLRPDIFIDDNDVISTVYHDQSNGNLFTGTSSTTYGYSISPALPTGLTFSLSTGTISGIPYDLLDRTMFTITATNSGGSSTAYINITVADQVPTLSYSPDNLTLTKNQPSTDLPLAPTLTGSGTITSWEISPDLPNGLNFGQSNGTIWGVPTVLQTSPVAYTVWANNSGGSTSTTINITINDEAPGPFEYIPENNIWTNNSYVNIGPSFVNITTGNGSSWQVNQLDPTALAVVVGDVVYLNGPRGPLANYQYGPLTALNMSNGTSWQVLNTVDNGRLMSFLVGDVIYFDAVGNGGTELWAYNTSNNTGWIVSDINNGSHSNPGEHLSVLVGDTIYFSADDGSTGVELWAHNTSNGTTWQVADIWSGTDSGLTVTGYYADELLAHLIGDTIYFAANDGNDGHELWAHNTSNTTTWQVADIRNGAHGSRPGAGSSVLVGDTIYFDADDWVYYRELWAHSASNHTTWLVSDIRTSNDFHQWGGSNPGGYMSFMLMDEVFYFSAEGGYGTGSELYAHNTSNHSTWLVADIFPDYSSSSMNSSVPGTNMEVFIGDTLYFDARDDTTGLSQLWAHDTSNRTTWKVHDASAQGGSMTMPNNPNTDDGKLVMVLGDTLYFTAILDTAYGYEMWAYDTSNQSMWLVSALYPGVAGSFPGYGGTEFYHNGTIYFDSMTGPSGRKLWAHSPLSINHQTNTGGAVTSWAINGTLPNGVSFNTQTGVLSGTPTELWPQTSYMVWANNSGGSSMAYLNITVVDYLPTDFTYNPDDLQLTNNTASADLPLAPQLTGPGEILSWELNNTNLPSGILFGSNNGTFYGTPTELWPTTAYKVWANNSGGSVAAYLNITVVDELPTSINYPVINLNLTNNTASPDLPMSPQITGPGTIISWEISGELPEGLTFDNNTGEISGIPTELWPTTDYTIWANNTGGSVEIEFNITVVDQLPSTFTYNPSDLLLANNTASPDLPLQPQLSGPGEITSWSINETLPLGLNFGNNNGTIWGIPTELQLTPKPFNITATNTGGSIYAVINITILEVAPTLEYDPDDYNFTRNLTITDIIPTYTPLDLIDTWEISPDVPLGLTFDNGTISGTPTVNMTRTEFTVWANNSGGSASATFNITIVEPTGSFAYVPAYYNFTRGLGISSISPNYNGGAIENWSIYPDLPTGLLFENGTISGTPTVNSTEVNYTVYANNSGGSVTSFISITVNEPVASIIYAPDERNETRTISMTPWFPQVTGGAVETWEIYPELPLGLSIVDGVISGTATVNSTRTNYTVWANNSGGSASTNIYLTVVEPVVELSYPGYELTLVRNVTMTPLMPQLSGGIAETWEIYPDLPDGIELTNGMISGTPTVNSTRTMYTIWANNTGGSTNVSLNITILEPSANIVYDPTNLVLTRGETMDPAIPDVDGGAIENWSIYPDLPDGLVFDNGTISGTPTVNMTIANYLIYGNNSGGSSVVGLSITILEPAPTITYQTDYLVLTRGETMPSALQAIFGGGAVASFTVTPELPDGLNFTNGTIFGTPTVNSTLVQYNITALNNGGSDYFLLNITILEPVAILDAESTYFELIRNEDYMNLTLNNTGGMAATWEIEPFLPDGLIFGNGTITGIPTINASLASYTIWANNTGGSDSIIINIKILEPVANISYRRTDFTVVNGQGSLYISPDILGGNPETWEFEPELPDGMTFSNGLISGTPTENLTTTTYTVWANNSGGSSFATINLTVDQPFFVVRYPTTILVLNVSENMPVTAPLYYFDEDDKPVWKIEPSLPEGLVFDNGTIFGVPTTPQPLTMYNITVTGELVPFTISVMIEILAVADGLVIEDQRNASEVNAAPPETVFPEPEEENIAYWLCPLALIILLWLTAMLYNAKKKNDDVDITSGPEGEAKED